MTEALFTPGNRKYWEGRLEKLQPDSPRQYGVMTITEMLAHLRAGFEISLEEVEVRDKSIPVLRHLLREFVFRVLPWPGGKVKTMEEFLRRPEKDFDGEKQLLLDIMGRFLEAVQIEPDRKTVSPFLGPTTLRYWQRIHGKHLNHHLTQFSV